MSHLMDAIEQHSLCCQFDLKEEVVVYQSECVAVDICSLA